VVRASRTRPDGLFETDQIERARRYHRAHYRAVAGNEALGLILLAWLSFGWLGDELYGATEGWWWWARCLAFTALAVTLISLVRLPVAFGVGYVRERRWGFSTQTAAGWLADRAKGLAVAVAMTLPMLLGLVALARALPKLWPLPAAAGAALVVLLVGFVAPVVIEPLFNRFAPLQDDELVADLRTLAEDAQVPIRDVLVTDASRRTRKINAYVSGLGRTRRVVLFDTLLERATRREARLVVAHELGHRRARHVLKGTLLAMAGAAGFVLVLWTLLHWDALLDALGARGPGDPRIVPFVLLLASVLELLLLPLGSALSRRWEREADYLSLELTRDSGAFESTHRGLALANLADLDPPRLAYVAMFSHPTPPERIAFGRRWAERSGSSA
jgi:STE24 endopeptidase